MWKYYFCQSAQATINNASWGLLYGYLAASDDDVAEEPSQQQQAFLPGSHSRGPRRQRRRTPSLRGQGRQPWQYPSRWPLATPCGISSSLPVIVLGRSDPGPIKGALGAATGARVGVSTNISRVLADDGPWRPIPMRSITTNSASAFPLQPDVFVEGDVDFVALELTRQGRE